jgi:hypothetical protein
VVLKNVDPLLTDADQLQQITGSIQTARDTFALDSTQMTTDLIYLENYEANPQNYPGVDQYSLIAQVNSEIYAVNADYANLTSYDGNFSAASTKFGNHANGFTTSVTPSSAMTLIETAVEGVALSAISTVPGWVWRI